MKNGINQEIPSDIRQFLTLIIEDSRVTVLNENVKEYMISELYTQLNRYVESTLLSHLPEDKRGELKKVANNGSELQQFLNENLPNSEEIYKEAFLNFSKLFIPSSSLSS